MPKLKEPTIYPGTERRDIYRDWNVSTEVPTPRKKYRNIEQLTQRSQAKSKLANEKLLSAGSSISKYKSPRVLAKEFQEEIRQEKLGYLRHHRDSLIGEVLYEHPSASKERVEALTFKMMRLKKERELIARVSPELNDPNLTHSPDLTKTLRTVKVKSHYHTGKWEKKPYEDDEAWSCCMNAEKGSQGCVMYTKDMKRWILSGY